MATLTAVRTQGGQFTSDDTLRVTLDNDGSLDFCVHNLEVVSGVEVTHGGGAPSSTTLHYKAVERDADGDGIIDYSTINMHVVQAEKGTSVIKVCASFVTTAELNAWKTERSNWLSTNTTVVESYPEGSSQPACIIDDTMYLANDGVEFANMPDKPTTTTIKSGEITLVWTDDV